MDLVELTREIASRYDIPESIAVRMVQKESSFNPDAENERTGAAGLIQIMEATAREPGFGVSPISSEDRFDPETNLDFGFNYLRAMYDRTGNWEDALRAYNAGLGNLDESREFAETNDYVDVILGSEPFTRDSGQTFITGEGDYVTREGLESLVAAREAEMEAARRRREDAMFRVLSRPFIEEEREVTESERLLERLPEQDEERSIFNPLRWFD
jgi:hypothetical protein